MTPEDRVGLVRLAADYGEYLLNCPQVVVDATENALIAKVEQMIEQAVTQAKREEFICHRCHLRQDAQLTGEQPEF